MQPSTSCGVLVFDASARLLLCHANGSRYWDIPKGMREGQESGAQAAAREAAEECGLRLAPQQLRELGRFPYRSRKDLWLFAVLVRQFEAKTCACSSFYTDRSGRQRPEMDGFRWVAFDQVPQLCAPSLGAVLAGRISLAGIHGQLLYEVGPVDAAPAPAGLRAIDPAQGRVHQPVQE